MSCGSQRDVSEKWISDRAHSSEECVREIAQRYISEVWIRGLGQRAGSVRGTNQIKGSDRQVRESGQIKRFWMREKGQRDRSNRHQITIVITKIMINRGVR